MPGSFNSPGSADSIWYRQIGANADYVPAQINVPDWVVWEGDIIVLTPDEPERNLWENHVGWASGDRCDEDVDTGIDLPIPDDFIVDDTYPDVPNNCAAVLSADGKTVWEFQPMQRCTVGGDITCYDDAQQWSYDLFTDDGLVGSHGGSGLPALFGTIRLNEWLTPGSTIPHKIKLLINGDSLSPTNDGFRWPASRADANFASEYTGSVPECRMGSVLALKPDFNVDALETEPGRIIARTLKVYGGIIVDQRLDPGFGVAVERSPDGYLPDLLTSTWGFDLNEDLQPDPPDTAIGRDWRTIIENLHVVDSVTEENPSGGDGSGGGITGMAWIIGNVTLAVEDEPDEGGLQFVEPQRWIGANPIGFRGRILQYVYTDAREHRLHFLLPEATKNSLKAIYDAQATVTFIAPRGHLANGVTVLMTEFQAEWNSGVRGENGWYDCDMVLVER